MHRSATPALLFLALAMSDSLASSSMSGPSVTSGLNYGDALAAPQRLKTYDRSDRSASTTSSSLSCRPINTSWASLPLFAHVRITDFSSAEKALMSRTLRVLTVQGTLYGNTSSEEQARIMRTALPGTPVLTYRNVYYAEPEDASTKVVAAHLDWQLKDASGKPLNPAGKLVYDMALRAVQEFYAGVIANLSDSGWVDGAFGDSGCGRSPNWLSPAQQRDFSQGEWNAVASAQAALRQTCPSAAFVSNCPYVPHMGDSWPLGVKGVMIESWCSDFQTGVGGPGSAMWCRDEILGLLSGPAAWKNGSVVQARYYLNGHNKADPRFGAIAFMIAAYEGGLFGASQNWYWGGDFERQSLASWTREPLGLAGPPQMLDSHGCGWNRTFASGASVYLNLCSGKGHPMQAHAVWADGSTWPKSLGLAAASEAVTRHHASPPEAPQPLPAWVQLKSTPEQVVGRCPRNSLLVLGSRGQQLCLSQRGVEVSQTQPRAPDDVEPHALAEQTRQGTPISLHPSNPHYFRFRGEATVLIGGGEHYGAIINSDFDYGTYLRAVKAGGGNVVRTWSGAYCEPPNAFSILRNTLAPADGKLLAPWARSNTPGYIGGGNRFNLTEWSADYFTRLHSYMSLASELGIVVNFGLFSFEYSEEIWARSPMHGDANVNGVGAGVTHLGVFRGNNSALLATQLGLVTKLVRELQAYDNVMFEIINEPYSGNGAVADSWQALVAATIKAEHTGHLVMQNIHNQQALVAPSELDHNVDVLQFHYAVPNASLSNYGLGRAIGYDETGFKGTEPGPYRRAAWAWFMSGGSTFNNLDYSFTVGHEDGMDSANTAPGSNHPEIRKQLAALHAFMRRLDFLNMEPVASDMLQVSGAATLAPPRALGGRVVCSGAPQFAVWVAMNETTAGVVELNLRVGTHSRWRLSRVDALDLSGAWSNTTVSAVGGAVTLKLSGGGEVAMALTPL
jgi:hypothetical protein